MRLSFKYIVSKLDETQEKIIDDLIWHTKKVSNILLYDIKEGKEKIEVDKNINIISSPIYKKYRENNWHSKYLHSHMLLEAITNVVASYKSYIKLDKMYKEDNTSLKGKPNFPKFKNDKSTQEIIFTKYAIRQDGNKLKLSISKKMQEENKVESLNFLIPRKLRKLVDFSSIKMIKIKKLGKEVEMNIIYEKQEKEQNEEYTNIMGIDLGLNNLVACTNKDNAKALLVSGRELKSKNWYINKKISYLQQINMKSVGSKKHKNTKQINKWYRYRKNYMNTYMHKVSKMVIEYAKENKCGKIVIGDIKDIKQGMDYNTNFVQVPIQEVVEKIRYKAKIEGIEVELISEKYTSGVSALDNEEVVKENYNKKRRIHRGMFVTNKGIKINADINGSLNILRKYIKENIPNQEIVMDNGREQSPLKKRVA